jgi:hypothetical protein
VTAEVVPVSLRVFAALVEGEARVPGRAGTVVDCVRVVVVTTALGEGIATETVARGTVASTVEVGIVDGTVVGRETGTVVGTVTVISGVVTVVTGVVSVVPSGSDIDVSGVAERAVASTFAASKPAMAKQANATIALHFALPTGCLPSIGLIHISANL